MAKDVTGKLYVSNNSTGSTSPSISDQQKVPPLRIVLNTAGNQKSSRESGAIAGTANQQQQQQQQQQQDLKRDRSQDNNAKTDNVLKTGGKVRIKLGANKQQVGKSNTTIELSSNKSSGEGAPQKLRGTLQANDQHDSNTFKEELTANCSHLRRITRRSQRTVQTVGNEDEESISSMTSTDENQNTNLNSDNNSSQDTASVATNQLNDISSAAATTTTATTNTATATTTIAPNNSNISTSNADTPRRYKRRKGEVNESSLGEHDGPFGFQNYKLPNQNSFELYKNIRKQVDKKLNALSSIHPKTPHGFRDYMLFRGAYLLDGNKLGNGTNLFMNEDGGLHLAPIGKYHALRHSRISYSVPNRAKVPLGLPVNSPLYNLFIDQEKERYRMRMQHIKEREKLTIAAEQEIMRVYNQAAMAAENQLEPFSACTMLKHQEIYNYLDSDGYAIQASEDVEQDEIKQEGVRTRRRQHEQITSPPARKSSTVEEKPDEPIVLESNQKEEATRSPELIGEGTSQKGEERDIDQAKEEEASSSKEKTAENEEDGSKAGDVNVSTVCVKDEDENENCLSEEKKLDPATTTNASEVRDEKKSDVETVFGSPVQKEVRKSESPGDDSERKGEDGELKFDEKKTNVSGEFENAEPAQQSQVKIEPSEKPEGTENEQSDNSKKIDCKDEPMNVEVGEEVEGAEKLKDDGNKGEESEEKKQTEPLNESASIEIVVEGEGNKAVEAGVVLMEQGTTESQVLQMPAHILTDDDRRAYNKEIFLSQLQDIDDKWDKIRNEMLIRHTNEAESLHAVQKLEWEWKTKEIGACDVRTTPIIDNTLVPKLNIYSQDY